jgi:hypothetical protein
MLSLAFPMDIIGKGQTLTDTPTYLRRAQAADYVRSRWGIPCSQAHLNKLASLGGGPVFRRAGRWPLYIAADLDAWAEVKITGPVQKAPADQIANERDERAMTEASPSELAIGSTSEIGGNR